MNLFASVAPFPPHVYPCILHVTKPCTKPGLSGKNADLFRVIFAQILGFKNFKFVEEAKIQNVSETMWKKFLYNSKWIEPLANGTSHAVMPQHR